MTWRTGVGVESVGLRVPLRACIGSHSQSPGAPHAAAQAPDDSPLVVIARLPHHNELTAAEPVMGYHASATPNSLRRRPVRARVRRRGREDRLARRASRPKISRSTDKGCWRGSPTRWCARKAVFRQGPDRGEVLHARRLLADRHARRPDDGGEDTPKSSRYAARCAAALCRSPPSCVRSRLAWPIARCLRSS